MKASELRKVAVEAQENGYIKHRNNTVYRIDELIKLYAKWGRTCLVLYIGSDGYTDGFTWNFRFIDRRMFKELKEYYKEKGFRFKRNIFNKDIYITW